MKKIILLVFALVFLVSLHLPLTKESTSFFETTVCVDPSTNNVSVGNTFVINVSLADDVWLQESEFYLGYNTTILDGLNAWANPPYETPIEPQINDTEGYVNVFAVYGGPIPSSASASESFPLASITFKATAVGSSFLNLYGIILIGGLGTWIDYTTVNGSVTVSSAIITVPDDYPTIQEAINAANDGDTIFVRTGTYYENVVVSKSISLIGENRNATIIDGQGYRSVIDVEHANVSISGFTIVNSAIPLCSGIEIDDSNNVNITNNIITNNNGYGVEIYGSSYLNIVSNNIITNNQVVGILIYDPDDKAGWNVIKANTIINNKGSGIGISESHRNTLEDNVMANQGTSIFFIHAANNTIKNNLITNNQKGIDLWGYHTSGNSFFHNNFINNTHQAYGEYISSNAWDDGYPSGGNYWSDYNGVDANHDGIGDTPYAIDENNEDNYPLMHPWSSLPVHNINTGSGYATIQEAINANETLDGHTIFVEEGIYYEHVFLDKSLSLIGENRSNTVIDGSGFGSVVKIMANNASIRGFAINNSGLNLGNCGVILDGANNVIIEKNLVANALTGIYIVLSDNNTLIDNIIDHSGEGLRLLEANSNNLTGNIIESNERGIYLLLSGNNIFRNNIMNDNAYNFGVSGETLAHFIQDIDTTNTVNGKTVYYLTNEKDMVVNPYTAPNAGYLAVVNSTQVKVGDLNLSRSIQGALFAYTSDSTITNVNVTNNWHGIRLHASANNTLSANKITENAYGIELSSCDKNTILGNTLAKNGDGIFLSPNSANNTITRNIVTDSLRGIYVAATSHNVIHHNNFINNSIHAEGAIPHGEENTWDYCLEGNYWDDYDGTDADQDGIGDSPYIIDVNNQDNYPLMGMFSDFNATLEYHVQTICNSSTSDFQFNGTAICFNVTGENDTNGFCRICIPRALMNETYKVYVNGTEVSHTLLPCSNSTHSYMYFTYNHSTQEVIVIPEFLTWTSMLFLLIVFTVAIVMYKRKLLKTPLKP